MKLGEIAARLGCELAGDGSVGIERVIGIDEAGPGDLTFVANPRYTKRLRTTRASAVILDRKAPAVEVGLLAPSVGLEHCRLGNRVGVQNGAVIGADGFGFAPVGDGSYHKIVQSGRVVLEDDVEIGANTTIDRAAVGETVVRRGAKL